MNRDPGFPVDMEEDFAERSIGLGADRRYWRRQANRRVRKARITRNLARWSVIAALQLAFVALVGYTGLRAWSQIRDSAGFSLKHIELVGAERAKTASIQRLLSPYVGQALFDLNLTEMERAVEQDPWVLRASTKRVLPDMLRIEITERKPSAIAIIGGLAHVVDAGGFVIGPTGLQHTDDVPVLTGLPSASEADGGSARLARELSRGVALLERLRRASPSFVDEISELDLSRRDRITLRTVSPGPLLLLDPQRIERNVLRFVALRPAMGERVEAAAFVDLRWQDRVSVMPHETVRTTDGRRDG